MIRNLLRAAALSYLCLVTGHAVAEAQTKTLPEKVLLPVASPLYDSMGRLGNNLQTGTIRNAAGELARGNHTVEFTLDLAAPYALNVEGAVVEPGKTITLTRNLSMTGSVLNLNIFPVESGKQGIATYTINLPSISVKLCPADMTEGVNSCTKILYANPTYICGSGYSLSSDNKCERTVSVPKADSCGTGFVKAGNVCVGGVEVPPIAQCGTGYALNASGECESQVYEKFDDCPATFSLLDGTCQKKTKIAKQLEGCPEGSEPDLNFSDLCVQTVKQSKGVYCRNISTSTVNSCHLVNDQKLCLQLDNDLAACKVNTYTAGKLECPTNATLLNGKCIIEEYYQLNAACPTNFTLVAGTTTCQMVETQAASLGCESGYTLSGSNCSKTTSLAIVSCPSTHHYSGGTCHLIKSPTLECESGYTLNGSVCQQNASVGAVAVCQDSYSWNGTKCERTVTAQGTAVCPIGMTADAKTGMCSGPVSVNPDGFNCPSGYGETASWTNNKTALCHKLSYSVCPENFFNMPEEPQSCAMNTNLYVTLSTASTGNQGEPSADCPASHPFLAHDSRTKCVATGYTKTFYPYTMLSCGTGATRYNSNCYSDTATTASIGYHSNPTFTYNASTGLMDGTTSTPPTSVTCPGGFTQHIGSICKMTDLQEPVAFSCEPGWTLSNQNCNTVLKADPITSCPTNYTAASSTVCFANSSANNVGNCPTGMTVSGTTCNGVHTVAAKVTCPSGWTDNGSGNCSKVATTAPIIECPAGATDNGTACSTKLQTKPHQACQAPYAYNTKDALCRYDLTTPKF